MALDDDCTLKDYCVPAITLLAFLTKTLPESRSLQLPVTEEQHKMTLELLQALKDNRKDLDLLHRLLFSLTAPPTDETPIGKWVDPLLCFVAASHLQVDGSFRPVEYATKDFAMWEYSIRGNSLFEIAKSDMSLRDMEKSVMNYFSNINSN
jgi:hypothetical protein